MAGGAKGFTEVNQPTVEARGLGSTFPTRTGPIAAVAGVDLAIAAGNHARARLFERLWLAGLELDDLRAVLLLLEGGAQLVGRAGERREGPVVHGDDRLDLEQLDRQRGAHRIHREVAADGEHGDRRVVAI